MKLVKGDVVDVILPGFGANADTIERVDAYLKSIGLVPNIPSNIVGEDLLSANRYDVRLKLLVDAFNNSDSKAIWAMKGGYGTSELIPDLLKRLSPPHEKLVIGFSDITALHNMVHRHLKWKTLHGPVLWQIGRKKIDAESIKAIETVIFGQNSEQQLPLQCLNDAAKNMAKGATYMLLSNNMLQLNGQNISPIVGGNMMLMQNSIGTCWEADLKCKWLFLEDIDEISYRAARVLHHMQQAGWFEKANGVVLGDFNYIDRRDDSEKMQAFFLQFAQKLSIPVFRIAHIGHDKKNLPLWLG